MTDPGFVTKETSNFPVRGPRELYSNEIFKDRSQKENLAQW